MCAIYDYVAWSLYTGPSNLEVLVPGTSWIIGKWDGINKSALASDIKDDIDARIDLVVNIFQKALEHFKGHYRFFIIPEFFFRCQQGPYPYIKIDKTNYPLEYIRKKLKTKLWEVIPSEDDHYYNIFSGTILTSNIENYKEFLESQPVLNRQKELNECLKLSKAPISLEDKIKTWNRHWIMQETGKISVDSQIMINNFMKKARANPLCTVYNRGIYFYGNKSTMKEFRSFIIEKQYESTVDLTMGIKNDNGDVVHGGMITEWMANYPSISIIGGDKQIDQFSTASRFTLPDLPNFDIGVEICLDHRKQRLRRTVDMCKKNGAYADNYPILVQIISSGGMQILDYAVAAHKKCCIFNADGCDKIYKVYGDNNTVILDGKAGKFCGITTGVYTQSVQSLWTGHDQKKYYSHSQIAFTTEDSSIDGFNNALGINNKKGKTFYKTKNNPSNNITDSYKIKIVNLDNSNDKNNNKYNKLFCAGIGELHCYLKT